ncbi:predicted protein [Arabidopsis lyrata subsp. lyrata]|uniref:Predicted protein n=1 Tax=Arabidopsis lyrata subsp. lyrata TaxID=81972 RepID=D7KV73_ARALL|nr:predicted protein [Arabidopsis lyrata subsp. lyrata]
MTVTRPPCAVEDLRPKRDCVLANGRDLGLLCFLLTVKKREKRLASELKPRNMSLKKKQPNMQTPIDRRSRRRTNLKAQPATIRQNRERDQSEKRAQQQTPSCHFHHGNELERNQAQRTFEKRLGISQRGAPTLTRGQSEPIKATYTPEPVTTSQEKN